MMNNALDMDNKGQIWSIQEEAGMYYTLTDAHELIRAIGLRNFLESLYHEKKVGCSPLKSMKRWRHCITVGSCNGI